MLTVATRKLTVAAAKGASRSVRNRALTAAWTGSPAPASRPRPTSGSRPRTGLTDRQAPAGRGQRPPSGDHAERAEQGADRDGLAGQAQQAEPVQHQRGEHLAADEEPDADQGAEPREQHDAGGDVQRAGHATAEVPRGHRAEPAERGEGAETAGQGGEQGSGQPKLERGCAGRAVHRPVELDVGGGLHGQQGAGEEGQEQQGTVHDVLRN